LRSAKNAHKASAKPKTRQRAKTLFERGFTAVISQRGYLQEVKQQGPKPAQARPGFLFFAGFQPAPAKEKKKKKNKRDLNPP
jgi:hypothetical protein